MTTSPFAAHTDDAIDQLADTVELDETGRAWHAEWKACRDEIAALTERADLARQNLEAILGDRVEARIDGHPVFTWKPVTSRSFDQARAREFLTEEQWAACQRTRSSRRFLEVK